MNKKERAIEFLQKLTELSNEYDLEITAEGTSPLLYDLKEGGYISFGKSFFRSEYEIEEID